MLMYTPLLRPLFWIVMGLLYALVIAGARVWAQDLGLQMNWFKWILVAFWYGLLSFSFAGGFTFMGEKEPRAGYLFLGGSLLVTIILGIILWFFL